MRSERLSDRAGVRGAGVLPEDIDTITGLRNALRTADAGQETQKVTAKDKTVTRKAVQARVEAAIDKIIAAADLALVDQPDRLALYHAVIPSRGKKAAAPKPTPAA